MARLGLQDLRQDVSRAWGGKVIICCAPQKPYKERMGHATVGICFTNSPEDGCDGFAISLNRFQGFKVCRKTTKEVTKNALTGRNESKNNAIKHSKCDLVLQDCNLTGSDTGTPSNPKFALKGLWENCLLPQLDALVAADGPCAGAIV